MPDVHSRHCPALEICCSFSRSLTIYSGGSCSFEGVVWELFRQLGKFGQFPIEQFHFLKQYLLKNRSKLRILAINTQPLKMVGLVFDTFMIILVLLMILTNSLYYSDLLLNLSLNFVLDVCLSVPTVHFLKVIQVDGEHLSYLGDNGVVVVELVVMKQG